VDFIYATQFTTLTAIEIEIEHFFYYFMPSTIIMKRLCVRRAWGIYQEKLKVEIIFLFSFLFFSFFFYFCFETWDKVFFCTFKQKKTAEVYRVFVFLMRHGLRMLRWDFGSESVL
jgi:hypothetical protein